MNLIVLYLTGVLIVNDSDDKSICGTAVKPEKDWRWKELLVFCDVEEFNRTTSALSFSSAMVTQVGRKHFSSTASEYYNH